MSVPGSKNKLPAKIARVGDTSHIVARVSDAGFAHHSTPSYDSNTGNPPASDELWAHCFGCTTADSETVLPSESDGRMVRFAKNALCDSKRD